MKTFVVVGVVLGLALVLVATACTAQQRDALLSAAMLATPNASPATPPPVPMPSETPAFSAISVPTLAPPVSGPMATLTAIAPMFATPVQNTEPYTIVNRGVPHFIEFHAWW